MRVTVVDRDAMPAIGDHRRGVPQGRHLHVLHPRGAQVLDELFPGLLVRMTAHGAVRGDTTGTGRWQLSGHRFRQEHNGISGILASRPFLEGHVRGALGDLPGVTLVPGHDIVGLTATNDRRRVTGVRLAPHGATAPTETLPADLVIDATGRGSRTPRWLTELGYPTPNEPVVLDGGQHAAARHTRGRIRVLRAPRHPTSRPVLSPGSRGWSSGD